MHFAINESQYRSTDISNHLENTEKVEGIINFQHNFDSAVRLI